MDALLRNNADFEKFVSYLQTIWAENKSMLPSFKGTFTRITNDKDQLSSKVDLSKCDLSKCDLSSTKSTIMVRYAKHISMYNKCSQIPNTKMLYVHTASHTNRGGGVEAGSLSTEAELCRLTNYWKALRKSEYPIKYGEFNYCTDVTLIRDSNYDFDESYKTSPKYMDILGVSMVKQPGIVNYNGKEQYEHTRDRTVTTDTLNNIARIAIKNKYDIIIFDRFGPHGDDHPIDEFIDIFKSVFLNVGKITVIFLSDIGNSDDQSDIRFKWSKLITMDNSGKVFTYPDDNTQPKQSEDSIYRDSIYRDSNNRKKKRPVKKIIVHEDEDISDSSEDDYSD